MAVYEVQGMGRRRLRCLVCGRVFPEGQGVVLELGGVRLEFHSKKCALVFLRSLLEHIEPDVLRRAVNETMREYREKLELLEERRRKVI
jgi:large subunit ribosomal protein L24e